MATYFKCAALGALGSSLNAASAETAKSRRSTASSGGGSVFLRPEEVARHPFFAAENVGRYFHDAGDELEERDLGPRFAGARAQSASVQFAGEGGERFAFDR